MKRSNFTKLGTGCVATFLLPMSHFVKSVLTTPAAPPGK